MKSFLYVLITGLFLTGVCARVAPAKSWTTIRKTEYTLRTLKEIPALKIAFFANSHLGATFDVNTFKRRLAFIQAENPDILFVVGDYVDDITTKEQMQQATHALGKVRTKYGIFFAFGNHDKTNLSSTPNGFTEEELIDELTRNNVIVLREKIALVGNRFYIIGRRDFGDKQPRMAMDELVSSLDKDKYIIVLDHQPTDFDAQEQAGVDLVLCGHTHGLFPASEKTIPYGHKKQGKTNFIVTSGLSEKLKEGTNIPSEFVIIHLKKR